MTVAEALKCLTDSLGIHSIQAVGGPISVQNISASVPTSDGVIGKLTTDSRYVKAGDCFIAIQGAKGDGHSFIPQLAGLQPFLIIVEKKIPVPPDYRGLIIQVTSTRKAWAALAAQWSGHPSRELLMIGVTGTNGKTSTTYIIEHLLRSRGYDCGVIGTIDHHLGGHVWPAGNTTPGPSELQARLGEMKERGAQAVVMEVSSHALDQRRVDGVDFDAVIFTNLSRDHLDYHKDMKEYFAAKQLLFCEKLWASSKLQPTAVVNVRDEAGRRLRVSSRADLITYSEVASSAGLNADWAYRIEKADFDGIELSLFHKGKVSPLRIPLVGNHQVENALGAYLAVSSVLAKKFGRAIGPSQFGDLMRDFRGVPGRLEKIPNKKGIHVFVDYAHSPDALENVLVSLQRIRTQSGSGGRIITVFGCGGDRDQGKRPMMAAVAEQFSDSVVITSDNPRTENPDFILDQIFAGFSEAFRKSVQRQRDRKLALQEALASASAGDVVVIAGKGHEDYQEIHGVKHPFKDQDVVKDD
jgi:UDP-N-acetylmuramoyl-L-alanyl-D-glutamate--2,6-diaminopimelate ligase